ncbi:ECF RNA polymerase sigma-E factor [Alteromonas sp. KUL42]|uniref:RNA polymerase sigma factor n=1 Tax=Alteromonas sp. KUL42 TaxID=2480797 RepID=UPI0007989222|nr:sigma-70 family RNA polymerase sigma factor [Alteromonas sp. KUL42]KXJ60247.1 MAG: RNA polymerase subunit sigma-70 [Alteromonas sp. Nap_26]TAP30862.1 sigma-70 family RNA polymerase sigma factor [Alteromonas sp. KUL42]GEA09522.1 ECF RNA polymerase sigma-E factor [Alteromonas sp. KUL42]
MFIKRDEKLVEQALKGNKKAWFTLISRYEGAMYQYGIRMTGNSHDAADLMQEIFVSVFRSLARFTGEGSFKSWLYRIAHCRCIELYRKRKPHDDIDDIQTPLSDAPCPEMQLSSDRESRALMAAMQQLPLSQKAVVELKFFGHFTFEEIAEQMDISTNTAKSRLYAALAKLKLELE